MLRQESNPLISGDAIRPEPEGRICDQPHAAVKSLRFLPSKKKQAVTAIEQRLDAEKEERVLLEAAGAGTALDSNKVWECLEGFVYGNRNALICVEAVFILTEIANAGARETVALE